MSQPPRLRDRGRRLTDELYPLNNIPDELLIRVGGYLIYLLYTGHRDITGSNWGDAFSDAIGGNHLDSPVGIADVVRGRQAWSMKTVKMADPSTVRKVRLISGRCSPDYSYGITDPHADIQRTGQAVLGIWNERVNIARDYYSSVRTSVLIRSNDLRAYCIFEEENHRYRVSDYIWEANPNGNLIGRHQETGEICFTWQPHGSQFTIHTPVPPSAVKFTIRIPEVLRKEDVLSAINFDETWVSIIR